VAIFCSPRNVVGQCSSDKSSFHFSIVQRGECDRFAIPLISHGAGPAEGRLLLQEGECLLNEGGVVLEDAAVPGVREDAQLCIRQPTGELE
jgi:hypothetical protein